MSEDQASQSLETPIEVERDADTEALFDSFGLAPKQAEKKDIEFPKMDEPTDPAIDQEDDPEVKMDEETEEKPTDTRKYKIKYNKEDVEVEESQVPELLEKGMALDKTRAKLTEQQKAMDEVAQLQGYKDHAELIANLPKLREQHQQKEQEAYNQLRTDLREQAEDAGLDPDKVEAWLDNHPLMKEAAQTKRERENERAERQRQEDEQARQSKWSELYQKYPHLVDDSQAFTRGEEPQFFTAEMKSRIERGYDPIDAFELAHRDTLSAQTKKSAEQKIIKQQQLGMRGHVNEQTATPPDEGSLLPAQIALAEEFGVNIKGVQRQNQLLKSRR
ncbi:hypothetical protein L1N85_10720 [Paenibacillus alkaliterrae]|uniref:hypothetical protein n=1 Tax=Paenibacillus alkaliterrae TaxID=320909 RepID=UPI001F34AB64|nr:hypothetical protein [Paenibacillus alkaliterrae]MCF2938909.1 hypothetical protein [Paenibacillus alkaliterrae]